MSTCECAVHTTVCTRVPQFVCQCDSFRLLCASTTYCVTWHTAQGHFCITHSGTALYPCDRSLCRWSRKMSWSLHAFCVHGTRAFEARLGGPPPNSVTANRKRPFLCCSTLFISLPCTRNISESTFALKSSQILKTLQPIGKSHVWVYWTLFTLLWSTWKVYKRTCLSAPVINPQSTQTQRCQK